MKHENAIQGLKFASMATIAFGLAMAIFPATSLKFLFDWFLDLAHLPLDRAQNIDSDSEALLMAISGGLMVGLGTLVWQVTELVYARTPQHGRKILLPGLLAWYLPDCFGSYLAGAWFNLLMNTGFLALFLVPLLLGSKQEQTTAA